MTLLELVRRERSAHKAAMAAAEAQRLKLIAVLEVYTADRLRDGARYAQIADEVGCTPAMVAKTTAFKNHAKECDERRAAEALKEREREEQEEREALSIRERYPNFCAALYADGGRIEGCQIWSYDFKPPSIVSPQEAMLASVMDWVKAVHPDMVRYR